jgi:Pyruvate/2-oxoacid:ferredoxin oxidoreductase delta subunit
MTTTVFFYCPEPALLSEETAVTILAGLQNEDCRSKVMDDLPRLAAKAPDQLQDLVSTGPLRILSPYQPRAVRWLFRFADAPLPEDTEILNLRGLSREQACKKVWPTTPPRITDADIQTARTALLEVVSHSEWRPWYPVVDYDKCVNCKQCHAFCLFGVYSLGEQGVVAVTQPDHCKNNCPACARVCPKGAILFPKFPQGAISGDDAAAGKDVDSDIVEFGGPGLLDAIRNRQKKHAEKADAE